MSDFEFNIMPGETVTLLTAGKYCDRNIVISTTGTEGYRFVKIASDFECVRAVQKIDITDFDWWESVTVDNIYCVTKSVKSTTAGTFAKNATCSPVIECSNGIISLNRTALSGSLVVSFIMDIYIALPL